MTDTMIDPEISVAIPCYNEEENAVAIAEAVIAQLEPVTKSFDIIFIDNASTDRTVPILRDLCARDPRVRLIVNARNFGQMRSPTHAIFEARGRAVIGICADFQDPPELLPQFVQRWREGTDIVLGVRESEKASAGLRVFRGLSYKIGNSLGDYPIVPNATGFGLYDRKVVNAIRAMREPEPFFRGMLVETGYSLDTIPYARPLRHGGRSSNNFFTLLDFALSSVASFSKKTIRLPFFIGGALGVIAGLFVPIAAIVQLLGGSGFGWLVAAFFQAQLAMLFAFIGIMGDQVRLISERTRQTPLVFERERINFPQDY